MYVTKEQTRLARRADLAGFLLQEYPEDIKPVGNSITLRSNNSLYIKRGVPGYHDFADGDHGNSIDFLTRYMGFSFTDAVTALCRHDNRSIEPKAASRPPFLLPPEAKKPFNKVSSYLRGRGIPLETVQVLVSKKLLYQDRPYGNAVFVTPERDYCEIRGTCRDIPFHGSRKADAGRFWYLLNGSRPEEVYICEAAIDAVSLMLIHKMQGFPKPSAYVSIGGVSNQKTIERIKQHLPAVLAVDNDAAGNYCRKMNPELPVLIPRGKDWNEDLQHMKTV